MLFHPYLLSPEAAEGITTTTTQATTDKAPDLVKAVESLIAKHGDPNAALRVLLSENYQGRDQIRDLKSKIPADGSLVLAGENAVAWNDYRALGKPEEIKAIKAEHATARGELAGLKRDESLRTVADKAGLKFSVLRSIVPPTAELIFVKAKDGKGPDVLTIKDGDAEAVPFDERFADFLPALKPAATVATKAFGTPPRNGTHAPFNPVPSGQQITPEGQLLRSGRYAKLS